jgi:anti-anti-sigma regulatory factor
MGSIKLQGRLDLGAVAALKAELLAALAEPTTIDAREVESIDTSCLQLLAAFTRESAEAAHPVRWLGASPAFTTTARRLDLTRLLDLDGVPSP